MPSEAKCSACRAALTPGATRCADCGAPVAAAGTSPARTKLAAFVLIVLFVLGVFQGSFFLANAAEADVRTSLPVGTFRLEGVVRTPDGALAANVSVAVAGRNVTTDAVGMFRVEDLAAGIHAITFEGPSNATLRVDLFLSRDRRLDVTLPAAGTARIDTDASLTPVRLASQVCGALLLGVGALAALGAIACWRRRKWGLALTAAILGVFASLPLSVLLGGLAVYLVASSRREFQA